MSKYDPPSGPPPPSYNASEPSFTPLSTPQTAHIQPSQPGTYSQDPYNHHQGQPNDYPPQQGGYYAPHPQMGYQQQGPPQGGYYGQPGPGPYGPQGGYGPGPGYGYGPQGQYVDNRRGDSGFMEAMLASLACCCCLDACLLF